MQPYEPPTHPPPVHQEQGIPSSAASSVWSCGALSGVSNESSGIVDVLSTSSSAQAGPADGPMMYSLPRCDLDEDGNLQVETVDLSRQSLKELKALCIGCQLPHSGTKGQLRDRLIRLSTQGMAKWKAALVPHAHISHKGMRSGSIRKPTRLQARLLNAEQKFGSQKGGKNHTVRGSHKDKRTQVEVDGLLFWADGMVAKMNTARPASHPLSHSHLPNNRQSSSLPIQTKEQETAKRLLVSAMMEALKKYLPVPFSEANLTAILQQYLSSQALSTNFDDTMDSSSEAGPSSSLSSQAPSNDFNNLLSDSVAMDSSAEAGPSDSPLGQIPEFSDTQHAIGSTDATGGGIDGVQNRVLHLADGQELVYSEAVLPVEPPTQYGNTMGRLISVWSNETPYYQIPEDPFYPIKVNGIPIPIKYWKDMYLRSSNRQWEQMKSPWMKWKFVMEIYELDPTEFRRHYSNNKGQLFSLSKISKLLRKERQVENLNLIQKARATLGENLDEDFQYRRGSNVKTMTRAWDIARLYRKKYNGEDKENE
ncbi:hypothetical protein F5146DRAFT_999018 [Armillaria mellea]|nr:hypothetical protein F5146DRAFT_999018 [Armillaria mellea]